VADAHEVLASLTKALGANAETGLCGAPLLSANGRGVHDFAPDVLAGDLARVLAAQALFAIGDEPWNDLPAPSARLVLATSRPVSDEDPRIEVLLPMAHAYERQASVTNLEGRVQQQEGGAAPPPHARPDWGIVADVASRLGIPASDNLSIVRARMAEQRPELAPALTLESLVARV
jgi:NADH dehydrogenase/NADH:ubiquinone oxidoreductase subunit G